jgi:hypothetical protein
MKSGGFGAKTIFADCLDRAWIYGMVWYGMVWYGMVWMIGLAEHASVYV